MHLQCRWIQIEGSSGDASELTNRIPGHFATSISEPRFQLVPLSFQIVKRPAALNVVV